MSEQIPATQIKIPRKIAEFILRYPEFDPVNGKTKATVGQIEYWLKEADQFLSKENWGELRPKAVMALAAVYLCAQMRRAVAGALAGETGPVTSAGVGGESVGYALNGKYGQGTNMEDWLRRYSPYGDEYLMLRDSCMSGVAAGRAWPWE